MVLGAVVWNREQPVQFWAQPSKHFDAFERSRIASKTIPVVSHPGGLASGNGEVPAAFGQYYAKFSSRANLEAAPPGKLPALPGDVKASINGPISAEEVSRASKKLLKNKSPGSDGIVAEFYRVFCGEISPVLSLFFENISSTKLPTFNASQQLGSQTQKNYPMNRLAK